MTNSTPNLTLTAHRFAMPGYRPEATDTTARSGSSRECGSNQRTRHGRDDERPRRSAEPGGAPAPFGHDNTCPPYARERR
jgi:hypothetical protein